MTTTGTMEGPGGSGRPRGGWLVGAPTSQPTDDMDRVTRARLTLMLAQPFLASAVARLPLVDATSMGWCPTAATDGYYVYVNVTFANTLSDDELVFMLAHEALHCIFGHADRRGARDRLRWNVAVDFATNALLVEAGFTLPPNVLYERAYAGMTAEAIYGALPAEQLPKLAVAASAVWSSTGGHDGGDGSGESSGTSGRGPSGSASSRLGKMWGGQPAGAKVDRDSSRTVLPRPGVHPGATAGYDLHLDPADIEGTAQRRAEFPTTEERVRLRAELGRELKSKLHGTAAGYWAAELEVGTERTVPWRELLARFVSGLRRADYRLFPPHRKHLWRGLYMPSLGVPGPEHLLVAVDTSGSMSAEELSQIFGEIDGLRSAFECHVTVVQCDAVIHHVTEHEPWNELPAPTGRSRRQVVYGRGGTDLRPPFAWAAERMRQTGDVPDALIYCTDGYGTFPSEAPEEYPVLWVLTHAGQREDRVPFGSVLRMPRAAGHSG